ncbi:DinB family protein [Alicyclobacillus ferrooxydans]|uniref:Damage-inducible protein DinB n=1 Tax=Alicyclobacillus ferrooxydans TaxID=471514 RepID=A0A0P9EX67_9BACL|nr:DinB family protein [Alicyclobacillus ferrooxydans]KPV43720.1 hypothetical protein AN477_11225 [Alicyclobacillus ferrooxydans]
MSNLSSQLMMHRAVLQDILSRVPEDQVDMKPWPNALSLSDLAVHMVTSADWFAESVKNGQFGRPEKVEVSSMSDLRRVVDEYTEKTKATLDSLSDEQVEGMVEAKHIFGMDAPGKVWLGSMRDHEIHHKGQMFVYARMAGVEEMPFFIQRDI